MNFFKWFKKEIIPRTGYVKKATCGHYVLADRKSQYIERHEALVHLLDRAKIEIRESPVTLCDDCIKSL